ncbi:hypothetical protein M513_13532 [Trichuris suis]|uniref:Uncharacterized protein n=1 Tax=Trichuris suis TaxID=68888 RepID=A0A085LKT9_9BILA|nr:hypothetical protein M513_13532 [Trichuris suis]
MKHFARDDLADWQSTTVRASGRPLAALPTALHAEAHGGPGVRSTIFDQSPFRTGSPRASF